MSAIMLPPNRPRLTMERALAFLSDLEREAFRREGEVMLLGIRGYYYADSGDNQRGVYDDAICVMSPQGTFVAFNANVDPSVHRPGIATLKPGKHRYRPGNHGISRPGGGYPAFRPATRGEALPVTRDGVTDAEARPGIAINIHRGGLRSTSSEGCQTIPPSQWAEFHAVVTRQLKEHGQKEFWYSLVWPR